jgi:hypothetical protein
MKQLGTRMTKDAQNRDIEESDQEYILSQQGKKRKTEKSVIEQLKKKITPKMEIKHFPKFERQAGYLGNGVYNINGTNLFSTDTRELFLMFCAVQEGIKFEKQ